LALSRRLACRFATAIRLGAIEVIAFVAARVVAAGGFSQIYDTEKGREGSRDLCVASRRLALSRNSTQRKSLRDRDPVRCDRDRLRRRPSRRVLQR
jgi:hypothetical protein